ncbi:uncharacterized protein PRCAT00003126001 [Priceomyces carsonii]|uniref:uncharacterized protein n=1 Tax=Priceomyces carsonii TaxID=28549 RepID=UPI002EDA3384|nr:unnamed protein product [Priceomyces carsonii]
MTETMTSTASKNTISGAKGITFLGETFIVPETHDVMKTLFDPTVRKSNFELAILLTLALNGLVFWIVKSPQARVDVFIGLYILWRFSYNFGIGYLLNQQSNHFKLVGWAKSTKVFDPENSSMTSKLVKAEIKSQMGSKYKISEYPIEFNTWLIFRKVVDLILMLDFFSFIGLVVACSMNKGYQFINGQSSWVIYTRLIVGSTLILFNLWVKVNAHNTIKDYAWYWGDFFFRQLNNEDLIFDGVFEMFPHPMYSVGYIGYYGFALISKSYTVLVVAIFGHFLQMIFLHYIENPHIDKIYGPSSSESDTERLLKLKDLRAFDNEKPLIGLWNFNFLRASDLVNLLLTATYALILPSLALLTKDSSTSLNWVMFLLTVSIKIFESLLIDVLLILQSYYKTFTKWYLSNDIPVEKSLNNWAIIYNTFINLTYSSFFGMNIYQLLSHQHDLFAVEYFYLRCFLGLILISTQIWINASIIDSIGYFGWFYGDFFIPKKTTVLTKAGVYRYLNNPEQIFGVCGIMGVTLISPTLENLTCCILWVANNFIRINLIEKIHMIKVYGEQEVLKDSGVTKTVKKHLLPDVIQRRLSETHEMRGNSLSDSLDAFIKELRSSNSNLSKQNLVKLSHNLKFESNEYNLTIEPGPYTIGSPIQVSWISPAGHSQKDWIGLYRIAQSSHSRNKTLVSSSGRWTWCKSNKDSYTFSGDKLFWEEGYYEFRYHLDGKHDVAFISEPFEIRAKKIEVGNNADALAELLKEEIFDLIVPIESIDVPISEEVNKTTNIFKSYKLLSHLISLSTDIKFDSKVFLNDDLTIRTLSSKLVNIQRILDELSHKDYNVTETKKNE